MRVEYVELLPGFALIKGKFPCCNRFLIRGERTVLIDAGCDPESADYLAEAESIEVLLNTHFHVDHSACNGRYPKAELWVHELEKDGVASIGGYKRQAGLSSFAADRPVYRFLQAACQKTRTVKTFTDGALFAFGPVSLQAVHTPGHSQGHVALWEPERRILLSGDVTLNTFGPWYGYPTCDIDQFIASIQRLRALRPKLVVAGHESANSDCGIFAHDLDARFAQYEEIIYQREERIHRALKRPMTREEVAGLHLIYETRYAEAFFLYEYVMASKHLERLARSGRVVCKDGRYGKA